MITDARVIELALKFEAYPLSLEPTIRGRASILEFSRALLAEHELQKASPATAITEEMVSRFLCWPLPKSFCPDCGISFDGRKDDDWNKNKTWPIGTNLLTAEQAREMLEHVVLRPHLLEAKPS